jgi:hypothetical protein
MHGELHEPRIHEGTEIIFLRVSVPPWFVVDQKSNCTLNLKKRAIRISVGLSQSV